MVLEPNQEDFVFVILPVTVHIHIAHPEPAPLTEPPAPVFPLPGESKHTPGESFRLPSIADSELGIAERIERGCAVEPCARTIWLVSDILRLVCELLHKRGELVWRELARRR